MRLIAAAILLLHSGLPLQPSADILKISEPMRLFMDYRSSLSSRLKAIQDAADRNELNFEDYRGQTALVYAAAAGDIASTTELLNRGCSVHHEDVNGNTVLFAASQPAMIRLLVSRGASPHAKNHLGESPVFAALDLSEYVEVRLAALRDVGVPLNAARNDGATPLDVALATPETCFVAAALINCGASTTERRLTPLMVSLIRNETLPKIDAEEWLKTDRDRRSAAMWALFCGRTIADLEPAVITECSPDNSGRTLLMYACAYGRSTDIARVVELCPASLAMTDERGKTPLMEAASVARDGIEPLLRLGVDVNARDKEGNTALHHAARRGPVTAVVALLRAGANSTKNALGCTPKDMALMRSDFLEQRAILEVLLSHTRPHPADAWP